MKKALTLGELRVGEVLPSDIITKDDRILVKKGAILTEYTYHQLIQWLDRENFYVEVEDPIIPKEIKNNKKLLQEETRKCLANIFSSSGDNLNEALVLLRPLVSYLYDDLKTIQDLPEDAIKIHYSKGDEGHYFRVAKMAVALASIYNRNLNNSDEIPLDSIAIASLLHDYGKRYTADALSLNNLRLDGEIERRTSITRESISGDYNDNYHTVYAYLSLNKKLPLLTRLIILYSGYQDKTALRVDGNSVAMKSARIIAICDAYDALLDYVVSQDMLSPFENVLAYMSQMALDGTLDEDLYKLFLKHIPIYPAGAKVLLSNNKEAVIIRRSERFPDKPTVLVLPPDKSELIDLSETTTVVIRRVILDDVERGVDPLENKQLTESRVFEDISETALESTGGPSTLTLQNNVTDDPQMLNRSASSIFGRRRRK